MIILYIVLLSIVSGVLYRLGGAKGYNTKFRDLGCPTVRLGAMFVLGYHAPWWCHVIAFGLLFGALTTYWDFLFGFDNFWFHGFMCGVAYVPYAFVGSIGWWHWIAQCVALAVVIGAWSAWQKDAVREEFGRGFVLPLSLFV
jgi:hypothetical protein